MVCRSHPHPLRQRRPVSARRPRRRLHRHHRLGGGTNISPRSGSWTEREAAPAASPPAPRRDTAPRWSPTARAACITWASCPPARADAPAACASGDQRGRGVPGGAGGEAAGLASRSVHEPDLGEIFVPLLRERGDDEATTRPSGETWASLTKRMRVRIGGHHAAGGGHRERINRGRRGPAAGLLPGGCLLVVGLAVVRAGRRGRSGGRRHVGARSSRPRATPSPRGADLGGDHRVQDEQAISAPRSQQRMRKVSMARSPPPGLRQGPIASGPGSCCRILSAAPRPWGADAPRHPVPS